MSDLRRTARRAGFVLGLLTAFLLTFSASCSSRPNAVDDEAQPLPPSCVTPQTGCTCTPGVTVPCGEKVRGDEHFVYCYEGTRTCGADGVFGRCVDGTVSALSVSGLSLSSTGIRPLALGTNVSCFGPVASDGGATDAGVVSGNPDPCDPYCRVRTDDPIGLPLDAGFGLVEGGLGVIPSDASVVPTSIQTTSNGDSTCGGAVNVHSNPCSASPLSSCQQDWRCDTASDTCVWNGGEGYFDPAAGGIDLTIGAGCEYSGTDIIPLCNRGSTAVPRTPSSASTSSAPSRMAAPRFTRPTTAESTSVPAASPPGNASMSSAARSRETRTPS